nr:MAG TPA: hypothetical protein [Caudoviricetes sp.]
MKIYYDYDLNKILTEEEAKESARQNVVNDTYALLEFIENNYSCEEILGNFKRDFLESVIEKNIESWLNEDEYFLVREIPD